MWENTFLCFKPSSLWYFVQQPQEDYYRQEAGVKSQQSEDRELDWRAGADKAGSGVKPSPEQGSPLSYRHV